MDILFKKNEISNDAVLIVGIYEDMILTKTAKKIDALLKGALVRALKIDNFSGKSGDLYDFIALGILPVKRLLCVGLGKKNEMNELKAQNVGAYAANALLTSGETAVAFAVDDLPAAAVGFGAKSRLTVLQNTKPFSKNLLLSKNFIFCQKRLKPLKINTNPTLPSQKAFIRLEIWSMSLQMSLPRSPLPTEPKSFKNTD